MNLQKNKELNILFKIELDKKINNITFKNIVKESLGYVNINISDKLKEIGVTLENYEDALKNIDFNENIKILNKKNKYIYKIYQFYSNKDIKNIENNIIKFNKDIEIIFTNEDLSKKIKKSLKNI